MKKIILSACCFGAAVIGDAQTSTFQWAKNVGGHWGTATGDCIARDASNNIYTVGTFQGRVDFNPGPGIFYLTSSGEQDIFISKVNASGNFVWAKQIGPGIDFYDNKIAVAVDASGNVLITGSFIGTFDFDPGAGLFNLTSAGSTDIFVLKLDASGNFVWAKNMGGISSDQGTAIALDASGNIYITGYFYGTSDFDPGAGIFNLNAAGSNDIFISKLDPSGNFIWAKQLGGTSDDRGYSIVTDASGNVYSAGDFKGSGDFNPGAGTLTLTSSGDFDIYVSKLDASGNFVWAKKMGGSSTDNECSITADGSGNVYITGDFWGVSDFDPGASSYYLSSQGNQDIFISKLDAGGNFTWAVRIGTTTEDHVSSIASDASGNIYYTGYVTGTVDFDPDTGDFSVYSYGLSGFMSELTDSGSLVWVKEQSDANPTSIVIDGSANVLTTGSFYYTVDFDPNDSVTFNLTVVGDRKGLFISKLNSSGNFVWAKSAGGSDGVFVKSSVIDSSGNIYTAGYFYGKADFNPGAGTYNLTTMPGNRWGDIFILKTDAMGNFVWAKQFTQSANFYFGSSANAITTDISGNVYLTGRFAGTVDFDPGPGTFNLSTAANNEIFICKLNASGNLVWVKQTSGSLADDASSIALSSSGNIYISGNFDGTCDFDPGAGTFNLTCFSFGYGDIFILKLDPSGNFLWAKQMGGSSFDYATSIALDGFENVYATGSFSTTADFDPGPGTFNLVSAGSVDIFVAKLGPSGNFLWAKRFGGTSSDKSYSVAVDGSGNVFTTGSFSGTADFDPGPGTFNLIPLGVSGDIFISKLDPSGNFSWAKQIGGSFVDVGISIVVDGTGDVYTTGYFYDTPDFDPGPGTFNLTSSGANDIFISKLDNNGNFIWAKKMGGANADAGFTVNADASNNVYIAGNFQGTGDFNPDAGTANLTALGNPDMFIVKMSQCVQPSATITAAGPTTFCSGGSVTLNAPVAANRTYQWKKNNVDISGATLSSYTATASGNYKVTVTNTQTGCSKTTATAIVVTVNALPKATITPQGPTTFCAGGSVVLAANTGTSLTYKWKNSNVYISGAALANYTATTAGTYRVEVTNSNGCSKTSAGVIVTVPCREGEVAFAGNDFDIKVFPNPSSGDFVFEFENTSGENNSIHIYDVMGKLVLSESIHNSTFIIHNFKLSPGVYPVVISSGENRKLLRLVKLE